MKIKLLFCFFIVTVYAGAQTSVYHPFPDSNAVWNVNYYGPWFTYQEYCSYTMNGDTLMGSNTWHKLFIPYVQRTGDTSSTLRHTTGYAGCIRQDIPTKKVFYLAPGDTTVTLLYDFNLLVGDTVPGFTRFGFSEPAMIIGNIDSVLVGSGYRKAWRFAPYFPFTYNPAYYIEGIGRVSGILEGNQLGLVADGGGFSLSCFKQNGITLYPDSATSCNIIDGMTKYEENISPEIFPNPATSELIIQNPAQTELKIESVEIYDVVGEAVLPFSHWRRGLGDEATINISSLTSGMYFARIKTEMGIITKKFIKQ